MPRHLLLSMIFTGLRLGAQNSYFLPEAADGAQLKTAIVLANLGAKPATVRIAATFDDSTPRSLTFSQIGTTPLSFTLAPGATRTLVTDGSGDGAAGAVSISSDVPVNASEILSNFSVDGNLISESAIDAISLQDMVRELVIPIAGRAGLTNSVSLYNPGAVPAAVSFRLLDNSGTVVNSGSATIPATGRLSICPTKDVQVDADFRGTLYVTSSTPLAGVALRKWLSGPSTVLPATSRTSHRLQFLIPGIADGLTSRGSSMRNRTSFVLTNLSQKQTTVNISLVGDDGMPLVLNISDLDTNSKFIQAIQPGASLMLQTDGAKDALTFGSATIRSDQPIALAALVGTFDGDGNPVSETNIVPAQTDYQLLVPFDTTNTSGVAMFVNAGKQSVKLTLTLTDEDGRTRGIKQIDSLGPGAKLTGSVTDFFPDSDLKRGAIDVSTGSPLKGFIAAAFARKSSANNSAIVSARGIPWDFSGTPPTVVPKLDATHRVTASVPVTGGTLQLTDSKGNRFTLTLPPNALMERETITMTAITSASGVPGQGLVAGVQLEPDGLLLLQPASLKIELASAAPADSFPIGWHGQAPGTYLNPPTTDLNGLTVSLMHFSGAGIGGIDETTALLRTIDMMDAFKTVISYYVYKAHNEAITDQNAESLIDMSLARDAFYREFDSIIEPLLQLALASDDDDFMRCAALHALNFAQTSQVLGVDDDSDRIDQITRAASDLVVQVLQKGFDQEVARCQRHDFTVAASLLSTARTGQELGLALTFDPEMLRGCLPMLELDLNSQISFLFNDSFASYNVDTTLSAKLILKGSFTAEELSHISDPDKDLYTSFTLEGSGTESYDKYTMVGIADCKMISDPKLTPDLMTVTKSGYSERDADLLTSQVQYRFNPYYSPQAVSKNGQQLCAFCPVVRKTPVKVVLAIDPGDPTETWTQRCVYQGLTTESTITSEFWVDMWTALHLLGSNPDDSIIQDWDLVDQPDLLAQKTISRTLSIPELQPGYPSVTEKTTLQLKPYTPPAQP